MARRRAPKSTEFATRVRHLLSVDASSLMLRLASRQDEMVQLFSRHRSRRPLIEAVASLAPGIGFTELAALEPHEQKAWARFAELLGELRWYLEYTEDMPGQVTLKLAHFHRRLVLVWRHLIDTIGPPEADGARVVQASVTRRKR
jgi:hypothetical protein